MRLHEVFDSYKKIAYDEMSDELEEEELDVVLKRRMLLKRRCIMKQNFRETILPRRCGMFLLIN